MRAEHLVSGTDYEPRNGDLSVYDFPTVAEAARKLLEQLRIENDP